LHIFHLLKIDFGSIFLIFDRFLHNKTKLHYIITKKSGHFNIIFLIAKNFFGILKKSIAKIAILCYNNERGTKRPQNTGV